MLAVLAIGLVPETFAQQVGNCNPAIADAYLDVNNVRTRILDNGNLFWRGSPNVYEVPKGSGVNALFASGIWLGGQVGGTLRIAGSTYGPYEFWAGPLDDNGNSPSDCSTYDRLWKVSRTDVANYEDSGSAIRDLTDWPTGLGAPTLDAEGNVIDVLSEPFEQRKDRVIDLAGGERPAILGDQMIWWIMNDLGNTHERTDTDAMGVEVHGSAFAFNTAGAIGNTTFYKYRIFYKGASVPLTNTYMGIFSDPDLGDFQDDWVGSDTTRGIGYVYNADNDDQGFYGEAPPAVGYDFFQGPIVPGLPTDTALVSGRQVPGFKNLKMTAFVYYNNGGGVTGDPPDGAGMYGYMRAQWLDGQRITFGGAGREFSTVPTNFMYPGDPAVCGFWTECNQDNQGTSIPPADRRFVMASGPFTIQPNDEQELVFGIVWSRGNSNLDSVRQLREDDELAQAAFDVNFEIPAPPDAPDVVATPLDGQVILEWSYPSRSNNFLERYAVDDPFAPDFDKDYVFEGYRVYQYTDDQDQIGKVVATYDVPNGVTQVIDGPPGGLSSIVATGSDVGAQRFHIAGGLTNYTSYFFGVQAYAYNENSFPKIYAGPIRRLTVIPTRAANDLSPVAVEAAQQDTPEGDFEISKSGIGDGRVSVDIINPGIIEEATYDVTFKLCETPSGKRGVLEPARQEGRIAPVSAVAKSEGITEEVIAYDVVNQTTGAVLFNGCDYVTRTGQAPPQRPNIVTGEGLQFSVEGPNPDFKNFIVTANAAGPLNPPDMAAFAFNSSGFPTWDSGRANNDRPSDDQQVGAGHWGIHTGDNGSRSSYSAFFSRVGNGDFANRIIGPYDFEIRFTEEGSIGYDPFCTGFTYDLPFELWRTGINTPDDPSDDIRMVPYILDNDFTSITGVDGLPAFNLNTGHSIEAADADPDIGGTCATDEADHTISGATNDPQTDWIYWATPDDLTPGDAGYRAWEQAAIALGGGDNGAFYGVLATDNSMRRMVLVNWNGGEVCPDDDGDGVCEPAVYNQDMPETGTVFRIITTKPNQPGDSFSMTTTGLAASAPNLADRLDDIGIVPNPYKGASAYEVSQLVDQVRFTNMPPQATIRVFSLNGTLLRTMVKNSPDLTFAWDLSTEEALPLASGMYLIHIDVPNVGEKVIKFGVVKKRVSLNNF